MKYGNEENNQMFVEHLSKVTFKFEECDYKFEELYNFLKDDNFPNDDYSISYDCDKKIYSLFKIKNDGIIFYFYENLFDLELCNLKDRTKEIKKICSTYEIFEIIKEKKDINFYYGNTKISNYNISPLMIENNKISLDYYPGIIEKIDFEDKYIYKDSKDKNFSPKTFDNNFYSYFPELESSKNIEIKFQYIKTKMRQNIKYFINQNLQNNKIIN